MARFALCILCLFALACVATACPPVTVGAAPAIVQTPVCAPAVQQAPLSYAQTFQVQAAPVAYGAAFAPACAQAGFTPTYTPAFAPVGYAAPTKSFVPVYLNTSHFKTFAGFHHHHHETAVKAKFFVR
jgi:hypothetical protein